MLFVRNLLSKNDAEPSALEDLVAQDVVSPEEANALSIMCVPIHHRHVTNILCIHPDHIRDALSDLQLAPTLRPLVSGGSCREGFIIREICIVRFPAIRPVDASFSPFARRRFRLISGSPNFTRASPHATSKCSRPLHNAGNDRAG